MIALSGADFKIMAKIHVIVCSVQDPVAKVKHQVTVVVDYVIIWVVVPSTIKIAVYLGRCLSMCTAITVAPFVLFFFRLHCCSFQLLHLPLDLAADLHHGDVSGICCQLSVECGGCSQPPFGSLIHTVLGKEDCQILLSYTNRDFDCDLPSFSFLVVFW